VVINIASIPGWSPQLAMSGQYGAAKAALIFDTERWALEFVPYGIRVNTVSPGSILLGATAGTTTAAPIRVTSKKGRSLLLQIRVGSRFDADLHLRSAARLLPP
jgi:NAD(P)-dependent dehydrogenase (short-subunit alcohol dehydrogenase family)